MISEPRARRTLYPGPRLPVNIRREFPPPIILILVHTPAQASWLLNQVGIYFSMCAGNLHVRCDEGERFARHGLRLLSHAGETLTNSSSTLPKGMAHFANNEIIR